MIRSVEVTGDALATVQRARLILSPARINPVIGRAATNTFIAHLRGVDASRPNALGGRRTHYFNGAARSTSFALKGDDQVIVSINQVGIRQRYFGGRITPKTAKFLTIPATPEAYGKRAREFADLKFAIVPGKGPALVLFSARKTETIKTKQLGRFKNEDKTTVSTRVTGGDMKVMFWLRKSVTQKPDPTIIPYPEVVGAAVAKAVNETVTRAVRRQNKS